jgi:thymidylate synthase
LKEKEIDIQYRKILTEILENGTLIQDTPQGEPAYTMIAPSSMRFRVPEHFPMITERNMAPKESGQLPVTIWRQAIGEICAFVNGARTLSELACFDNFMWGPWVTKEKCIKRGLSEGDLGLGSYGAAFASFPTNDGKSFNQFAEILMEIKENPNLRTFFVSPWIPQYIPRRKGVVQKVIVAPCHGWVHIRIMNNKLTLHMFQRSADMPVGVPSNMIQYAALTMMIAQVTGYEPYEYVHSFSDAHIYKNQIPAVEKMLARTPRALPSMQMNASVTDLFSFSHNDFILCNYDPHPGIKGIPVGI